MDEFTKEISEASFLAVWADYCKQKEELVDKQAEIDKLVDIAERALKAIDNPLIQNDLNNELAKHRKGE